MLAVINGNAQTQVAQDLSVDPAVTIGKLDNGLTYYIRQNKKPEQKVELRLALKAGSILEDDNQQGLAHMAEHMAFNGTKNFKKNDIVSFLQDIGVGFGSDLNAYTSFDETVYILPIPTDKAGNLEKGFQVLEDWAHQVTYLNEDIESERAIILEESRLGKGAYDRMMRQIYPKLFAGSRYANRIPIGVDSIIRTFNPDLIRKFYKDWYRPDLMAVMVVGDVEPSQALALIRKHFSGMKNPTPEKPRERAAIGAYPTTEAMVVTDREATSYSVNIVYPLQPMGPQNNAAAYRKSLVDRMFTSMLNQRLQEIAQQPNPPFVGAGSGLGEYIGGYENFRIAAGVGSGDVKKGTEAIVTELERVQRYGFTEAELARAKKTILNGIQNAYNNRDKTESELYVEEYVRNFLTGESIPGIAKEFEMTNEQVPGITLDEVNATARRAVADANRLVYVLGPEPSDGKTLPGSAELLAVLTAAEKADIKPYEEKTVAAELLSEKPKAGKITGRTENKALGTTTITLSNGVKVTLKPTSFKDDQILLSASRPGGKNNYGVADRYNAEYATAVVSAMGVGNFSPADLRKSLAGKTVSVNPVMGEVTDGFRGSSSNRDVEVMFQLLHLYATSPRIDTGLFQSFVQRNKAQVAGLASNPQTAFVDTMFRVMYKGNPLAPIAVPKATYFDQIDVNRAVAIYREQLNDVTGMQFVLAGSFKTDSILPLLETYIGSLPASGRKFERKDNGVRPVGGVQQLVVNKGKEAKSLILKFFTGEVPYSEDLDLKAQAISEILNIRIIEELREKIQGIYGGGIYAQIERYPYQHYSFVLQLPCGPEKVDTLLKAAQHEINLLVQKGPEQKYLDKVKKSWLEQYKVSVKENGFWLESLQDIQSEQADPKFVLQYEQLVQKLTVQDIQAAAKKLFDGKNQFSAVLMPEGVSIKKGF
ncbi:putative phosphatase [Flavihumibacter petaseus NBRC 106054]|uniref:Putative phosphatase n=2 Tax=Flavihumibacter TaxID=1004301 RepID=A0A0E9N6W0_9BACT|nr:putative phosphatase [Flavihumibacter petaseus NBRC 106054]